MFLQATTSKQNISAHGGWPQTGGGRLCEAMVGRDTYRMDRGRASNSSGLIILAAGVARTLFRRAMPWRRWEGVPNEFVEEEAQLSTKGNSDSNTIHIERRVEYVRHPDRRSALPTATKCPTTRFTQLYHHLPSSSPAALQIPGSVVLFMGHRTGLISCAVESRWTTWRCCRHEQAAPAGTCAWNPPATKLFESSTTTYPITDWN
ncbi:hypothetical protein Q7P37_009412 [Cladosporium fusiforme]